MSEENKVPPELEKKVTDALNELGAWVCRTHGAKQIAIRVGHMIEVNLGVSSTQLAINIGQASLPPELEEALRAEAERIKAELEKGGGNPKVDPVAVADDAIAEAIKQAKQKRGK